MMHSFLLSLLLLIPIQTEDLQEEYYFINWFFRDKGEIVYLLRKSSQVYTEKVWNGGRNEALDYEYLSDINAFPIYKEERKIATDYLSINEISRMKDESYVGITFDKKKLDDKVKLIKPGEYNLHSPDSTTGFWSLGRPLFNDDKTVCLMYVSRVHTNQYSTDGLSVFQKTDGEWKEVLGYVGWVN